jgi:hypothetical protein
VVAASAAQPDLREETGHPDKMRKMSLCRVHAAKLAQRGKTVETGKILSCRVHAARLVQQAKMDATEKILSCRVQQEKMAEMVSPLKFRLVLFFQATKQA